MGEIFYGKIAGVEGFEREVAIKKMLPHLSADNDFIRMMIKEAKLTVLLNHPNIVQVYDLSKEAAEYYIAMEYVPGINCGTLLEKCRLRRLNLPVEMAVYIVSQVLRGLEYAHSMVGPDGEPMHILHRDITPQNIMITRDAWVKITDFGIAKARNEISTTTPGMIKGKLGYIAPEQLAGQEADHRIDLFCAGIVLWECLAVRRLFKGHSEVETFRMISDAQVPSLREVRHDVSQALEDVIMKGLARDPNQRFENAEAFYEALNQAIYPTTIDECANITKAFLAAHSDFFGDVGLDGDSNPNAGHATLELHHNTDELCDVLDLVTDPYLGQVAVGTTLRRQWLPWTAFGLTVLLSVGGTVLWQLNDDTYAKNSTERAVRSNHLLEGSALTVDEVQLAADGEESRILACYRQAPGRVRKTEKIRARLVIASTGGVAHVRLTPSEQTLGRTGDCLSTVLKSLQFRPHHAPKFVADVTLPDDPGRDGTPPTTKSKTPPKPLTTGEIQATVQRHSASIIKCLQAVDRETAPPKVEAQIAIELTGRVSSVSFRPALPQASVQQCLAKNLRMMRFRRHPVRDFKVTIPLEIQVL